MPGLGRNRDEITVKRAPLADHGEGDAGQFVRQRASGLVVTDPGGEIDRPALESGQGLLPGAVLGHGREQSRAGAVNEQHSQVTVAPLADAAQAAALAATRLARGQAQPGREMATVTERRHATHCCNQGGRD